MATSKMRLAGAAVSIAAVSLLLAGCTAPASDPVPSATPTAPAETVEPVETEAPGQLLESFDFGNAEWTFVPYTEKYPPILISVVDGAAELDGMQYTVVTEEVLFSDADGDGRLDALVPIEAYGGGNAIDRQWYIWVERGGEAVQVGMPVARTIHCGTLTVSVKPVDGGFEIHELRHAMGENDLACTEPGSDERVRTVGVTDQGPGGVLWPVQVAPFNGFGGICPASAEYENYPIDRDVYAAPDSSAAPSIAGGVHGWTLGIWPIYEAIAPDWHLIGVSVGPDFGCAWVQ